MYSQRTIDIRREKPTRGQLLLFDQKTQCTVVGYNLRFVQSEGERNRKRVKGIHPVWVHAELFVPEDSTTNKLLTEHHTKNRLNRCSNRYFR